MVAAGAHHLADFSPFTVRFDSDNIEFSFESIPFSKSRYDTFKVSEEVVEFELWHALRVVAFSAITRF